MLCWIDLETTGLNEDEHHILEVACVITDDNLVEVASYTSLVLPVGIGVDCDPHRFVPQSQKPGSASGLIPIYEAHFTNGLVDELRREYNTSDWQDRIQTLLVGQTLTDFIRTHCKEEQPPLCGSSVHFDRRFLARRMPWVLEALHYRNVDVSTVKELAWRWRPSMDLPPKGEKHRALDDIYDSIRLLRFYRQEGFIG